MMYAEFLRFYNYTADEALAEYAKRFFALCSMMYRIQAKDSLNDITVISAGTNGGQEAKRIVDDYRNQFKGNHGILQEVRTIKG